MVLQSQVFPLPGLCALCFVTAKLVLRHGGKPEPIPGICQEILNSVGAGLSLEVLREFGFLWVQGLAL